jgi:hypothetical protein
MVDSPRHVPDPLDLAVEDWSRPPQSGYGSPATPAGGPMLADFSRRVETAVLGKTRNYFSGLYFFC